MKIDFKKIFHSLTLRIPQRIALRNGLRVTTYSTADNSLFWSIFTSDEYLSFVPYLVKSGIEIKSVVDCGAACGYFSLLVEHLCLSKVLKWHPEYFCVEPAQKNFAKLQDNFNQPNFAGRHQLVQAAIGQRSGYVTFYESSKNPWSSSVNKRTGLSSKKTSIEYYDIAPLINNGCCLIKLDIEGSEFSFLESYFDQMNGVGALIIEWHHDEGDVNHAKQLLDKIGMIHVHTSRLLERRSVELYMRKRS